MKYNINIRDEKEEEKKKKRKTKTKENQLKIAENHFQVTLHVKENMMKHSLDRTTWKINGISGAKNVTQSAQEGEKENPRIFTRVSQQDREIASCVSPNTAD